MDDTLAKKPDVYLDAWNPPPFDANDCDFLPPPNAGIPPGWVLDTSYCQRCGLYMPAKREDLPAPIQWETCPSSLQIPQGIACRHMVLDWKPKSGSHLSPLLIAWPRPNGAVALHLSRFVQDGAFRLIAEADGPILQAIYEGNTCVLGKGSLQAGHATFFVYERTDQVLSGLGVIGGDIDELHPRGYFRYPIKPNEVTAHVENGQSMFYHWRSGVDLYRFADGSYVGPVTGTGLGMRDFFFHDDVLFWEAYSVSTQGFQLRRADGTVRDLVWFGSDFTRAASGLGTDGSDYVWFEAYGRASPNDLFQNARIMTGKYTEDPSTLLPRRLRSESPGVLNTMDWVVGCGYAMGRTETQTEAGVRIIRLSDGASWTLKRPFGVNPIRWNIPLALTCQEAFIYVDEKSASLGFEPNVARIRLDSLGTAIAPD